MIGQTVLHYKIIKKLGEGGMGIVYLAEDINLERKVAIKFLPRSLTITSEDKERFKIEAKAAAALNHPNISTIHSIEEINDDIFIVMEYVEGKELKDIVETHLSADKADRDASLPIDEIINYATQIAEGLEAAHKKGIVHRDIKSQNIMITENHKIKIMDFGLAKIKGGTQLTKMGATVGTLAYMSPEQARGEEVDQRTDIWAFGVVIYEMLTGKMPFSGEYEQAVAYSILNEEPEEMDKSREDIPGALLQIVKNSLQKNIDNRYQSTEDLLTDLRELNKSVSSEIRSTVKVKTRDKTLSVSALSLRKKLIFVTALVCLLAVAVAIYFNLIKDNSPPLPGNQNKSLAVMYFENIPDPKDETHTDMITTLLITALSQTKGMEVISREQLYRVLDEMGLSDNKIITQKTAIKVAQYANVSTILVGSIVQSEPSLAVTTQLIDVKSGKILESQRLVGYKSEPIFTFVDSLALLVRNDLQIKQADTSEIKSVAVVTTNSPEAYRAYLEGLNLGDKAYGSEATAAFKKAIELDSSFAMAYYYLGGSQNIKKAVELADNTTERERLLIFAMNYRYQNKPTQAAEIYKQIIEKYPHEIEAYENLASIHRQDLDLDIDLFLRGVRTNPSSKMLWNDLAISYTYNNQKQKALDAVDKYIKLAPAEPNPYDTKGFIYAMFMEYDSSAIFYNKALEIRKDFELGTAIKLGFYEALKGKYKEAQKYFDMSGFSPLLYPSMDIHRGKLNSEFERLSEVNKSKLTQLEEWYTWAILEHLYYETGRFAEMLRIAKEGVIENKKTAPKTIYGRDYLAWALAKNGRSKEAESLLNDILKNADKYYSFVKLRALFASALVSFEEGKYELSIEKFKNVYSKIRPNHEPNLFYAVSLLKTGLISEAVEELNRLKNWPMDPDLYWNPFVTGELFYAYIPNVKAHYWLGVAHEKLGEKEKAIKEYKIFLNTWKDADFNSPEIKDAKVRLKNLKA
jgi:serine/threonine protein kinase